MHGLFTIITVLLLALGVSACAIPEARRGDYVWRRVTEAAAFPQGYNYPVFVVGDQMLALNGGGWRSRDGKNWTKTVLPEIGLNSAYQDYVLFGDAVYALGSLEGNYLNFKVSTRISRTRDFEKWETLAEKSELPERVFYGAAVFRNKIWLVGGFDGKNYHHDVWNSADGVRWQRVADKTAFSPRNVPQLFVFRDRLWFIGGGVIDGEKSPNPNSEKEVWSSADGVNWSEVKVNYAGKLSGSPIVFDDKLWLVGANRNDGNFDSAVLVTDDGVNWRQLSAPWSPRGGTAVWTTGDRLFLTGGKYSHTENGAIRFVYSNDVWALSRK